MRKEKVFLNYFHAEKGKKLRKLDKIKFKTKEKRFKSFYLNMNWMHMLS
jgi:uncharacterized protein YlbG (UPF0298 family)